ncbi:MAG: hypothetical protein KDA78_16555, partial [Planctomycetaceae bacterium]|nr:hypothetical protein [Planctomycetaceae bacterium]
MMRMWSMVAAGLMCGFLGMYLTVTRPMSSRMAMLEGELAGMQQEMHQLVGTRDELWRTNDLLTGLRQQQRQMAEVEASLASIRQMRHNVLSLAAGNEVAMDTLQQMASMQKTLVNQAPQITETKAALAQMVTLQGEIVQIGNSARISQQTIAAVDETMKSMRESADLAVVAMNEMQDQMDGQTEMISNAKMIFTQMEGVMTAMIDAQAVIETSQKVTESLESMQEQVAATAAGIPQAREQLSEMTALRDDIANQKPQTMTMAKQNWNEMVTFHDHLAASKTPISSAIETVELLEDFQKQIALQANELASMRRELQEITMLKVTVEETLAVLKPLIQLSDLRRMSDTEVRDAARVILDRRMADGQSIKSPRVAEGEAIPTP